MRAIDELEENTERLDLLDYEATKARLAEIRKAEEELSGESPEKSGSRGRPREPDSRRAVAEKTGSAPKAQREI